MAILSTLITFLKSAASKKVFDEACNLAKQRMLSSIKNRNLSISKSDLQEAIAQNVS